MHSLSFFILVGFFVVSIHSRPSQSQENNESQEDIEYEGEGDNESTAEDTLEDSRFGDEDSNGQEIDRNHRLLELNKNNYLQKDVADDEVPRSNSDTPDYKPARSRDVRNNKLNEAVNDEFQNYDNDHRFIDANNHLEASQHLTSRDVKNYKNNRIHKNMILDSPLNKRALETKKTHTEESEMLFENNGDQINNVDKNGYNYNEPLYQRSTYPKQNLNHMLLDSRAMLDTNSQNNADLYNSRDRREAMKSNQGDAESVSNVGASNDALEKSDSENEEMAIKRHIKKMTGDELEQLLNSLSEDKRALLKKIIDDIDMSEKAYDTPNKREITKKAEAVNENAYIESGQSESSKVDGGSSAIDIETLPSPQNVGPTSASKEIENQQDTTVLTNPKPLGPENKADLKVDTDSNPEKTDSLVSNKNQAEVAANEQITSKNEKKRETDFRDKTNSFLNPKIEDEYNKETKYDQNYFFPESDDLSQFLEDVQQSRSFDSSKIYKREVESQSELNAKLKSLEESFPNSDAYDESGAYTGPLIRVKRKNGEPVIKKRSAAVLPDAKVGYCPYKAESDDDDTDEGNEFDDDGFYDPTPNFVNSNNKNSDSNSQKIVKDASSCKLNPVGESSLNAASADTMNLGSDTDNVLSGVEGVDENHMFSSGTRNRRKTDGNVLEHVDGNNLSQSSQGKVRDCEVKSTASNDLNIPNYQDNDSFGGYPRNYEGDLGRYKRIRRVKQSHLSDAPSRA